MTTDYTIDRTSAADMLAEDGQLVTLTSRASGSYDVATGTAPITTSTQTAYAAIDDLPPGLRYRADSNILATDKQCFLSALTASGVALTRPAVGDTLTDTNSRAWTVVSVGELSPAGVDVLYDIIIRGAD